MDVIVVVGNKIVGFFDVVDGVVDDVIWVIAGVEVIFGVVGATACEKENILKVVVTLNVVHVRESWKNMTQVFIFIQIDFHS